MTRDDESGAPSAGTGPLVPTEDQLRSWGLDPGWSRLVTFRSSDATPVTWHVLDTAAGGAAGSAGTVVCVHGNPTWGYLWRDLLTTLAPEWRVVAVDQTSMGYSERLGARRLADRVAELVSFCRQEAPGPLVLAAHDWGGPIAVGAAGELDVRALILCNTAVAKPAGVAVPPLIGVARRFVDLSCRWTPAFVAGTSRMTARSHRDALRAPYRTAQRRSAVADFVADIPVGPGDPSAAALERSAAVLDTLRCPVLLVWGGRDPVFHDRFLRDLRQRVPHAHVERFPHAGHLVPLDEPIGPLVGRWLTEQLQAAPPGVGTDAVADVGDTSKFRSVLDALDEHVDDRSNVYVGPDGTLSWSALVRRSTDAASVLVALGVVPGDRVAVLVPPSAELLVAVAAIWTAGGTAVAADASSGLAQLRRLIRAAAPAFVVGTPATLAVARVARFAPGAKAACFGSFPGARDVSDASQVPTFARRTVASSELAAIVHTSGATGPAKPVRYTHGALAAQRDALVDALGVVPGTAFTTSFGPFMLLAPSLGMTCVRPDFDPNKPAKLDYDALDAALRRAPVTTAWLSPASARTIVSTAAGRRVELPLVLLAGAPVVPRLSVDVQRVTGGEVRAPYGMTECLPVTDGTGPTELGPLGGTATGHPLEGCELVVVPLGDPGGGALGDDLLGELLVAAPWMFDGYDARLGADMDSTVLRDGRRFHRTGDVGYLHDGVVFQLGRAQHVVRTAEGPVASVAVEALVAAALDREVAVVGVGPAGAEVVAIVVGGDRRLRLADADVAAAARAAAGMRVAAVLVGALPVDRRHQSKVDRTALRASVDAFLAGR